MLKKILLGLLLVTFLTQIAVSFYYSSFIVSQNQIINHNLTQIESLNLKKQQLKIQLSQLTSIQHLLQYAPGYTPITSQIDLNLN